MSRTITVEQLRELEGLTIANAQIETFKDDDDHDTLVLVFTDGTRFKVRSHDADGYQSWLATP